MLWSIRWKGQQSQVPPPYKIEEEEEEWIENQCEWKITSAKDCKPHSYTVYIIIIHFVMHNHRLGEYLISFDCNFTFLDKIEYRKPLEIVDMSEKMFI